MAPKGKKPKPTYADHMPQRLKDTATAGKAAVKIFDDAVNGIAPRYTTTNELDTDELCLVLISEAHFPRKKVTAKKCYLRTIFDGRKKTQVRLKRHPCGVWLSLSTYRDAVFPDESRSARGPPPEEPCVAQGQRMGSVVRRGGMSPGYRLCFHRPAVYPMI